MHIVPRWMKVSTAGRKARRSRRFGASYRVRPAVEALEVRLVQAAGITASYAVTSSWASGFQESLTLANAQTAAVANWQLGFDLAAPITSIWDAKVVSHVGNHYVIAGAAYDASLPAAGSVTFGFVGGVGSTTPANLTVNGVAVGGGGTTTPPAPAVPTLSVANAQVVEGNSGTTNLPFTVTLSSAGATPVTVKYATSDGTATAGSDYTATSGTLTFAAGQISQTVNVPVLGDAAVEPDETLKLTLSAPSGATLANAQATGTIRNDDAGQVTPSGVAVTFKDTSDWGTGFNGEVDLANNTTAATGTWTLAFDFAGQISSFWNATPVSHVGNHFVVTGASWNATIAAGGTTSFGFGASPGGGTAAPTNFAFTSNASTTPGGGTGGGGTGSTLPVAVTDAATTAQGTPVIIPVLANDTDAAGNTLALASVTQGANGAVVANADGTVTYTPEAGFLGADTFTYVVSDGKGGTATGTVSVAVVAPTPAGTWPAQVYAPYVDMGLYPTYDLAAAGKASGIKFFTLAFITADPQDNPSWGGYASYDVNGSAFDLGVRSQVAAVRALGGDVSVSFGGASGQELAQTLTDVTRLTAAYQTVVTAYGLTHLDFDIEGAAVADHASIDRRSQALAALEKAAAAAGKPLSVWFTLPVLPTGLTADGLYVVQSALKYGVQVAGVNGMAMDYGESAAPNPKGQMGTYAIDVANSLHDQLKALYGTALTDPQIWAMVGVTPMIGLNDDTNEVFDQAAASQLTAFAQQKGIGRISIWSLNRDRANASGALTYVDLNSSSLVQQPYDFSRIFEAFQG